MRIEWKSLVKVVSAAAFFAALALDLTVPVVALSALALVDRALVAAFLKDVTIPEITEEQMA